MDIIQHLIKHGADPTVRDNNKQDAQEIAVFYQQNEVANFFANDSPFKRIGDFEHKINEEKESASEKRK